MDEEVLSSTDDDADIVTEISSDESDIKEELQETLKKTKKQNLSQNSQSQTDNSKLLSKRKSECPQTFNSTKETQSIATRPPSPSRHSETYSPDFHSDDEDTRRLSKVLPSAAKSNSTKRRIVSPYGQCLLSIVSSSSAQSPLLRKQVSLEDGNVAQQISSARLRWRKEKMNDVASLHQQVLELTDENRTLNRLVKRQSLAINRLAGTEGELPILLRAHNEETRVLKQKLKQHQELNRSYEIKLEQKSREITQLKDSNKKLDLLIQKKDLKERGQLEIEMHDVKMHLQSRDNEVKDLYHRLLVTEKSSRQQLKLERGRVNGLKKKLDLAEAEIGKLKETIKEKDKIIHRNNIYSRHYMSPTKSPRNTGYGSMTTANSMMSLRVPSTGFNSGMQTRSKSFHSNLDSSQRGLDSRNITADEQSWGLTVTRPGTITPSKSESDGSETSSSDESDEDEKQDTLNGIEDMPEHNDKKLRGEITQDKLEANLKVKQTKGRPSSGEKSEEGTIITEIKEKMSGKSKPISNSKTKLKIGHGSSSSDSDNEEEDPPKRIRKRFEKHPVSLKDEELYQNIKTMLDKSWTDDDEDFNAEAIQVPIEDNASQNLNIKTPNNSIVSDNDDTYNVKTPLVQTEADGIQNKNETKEGQSYTMVPENSNVCSYENPIKSNKSLVNKNHSLSDDEDEGIGNGETQSEKDGDTPAELKPDFPNDDKSVVAESQNVAANAKSGIWLPHGLHPDQHSKDTETSTPALGEDKKVALLAKLRELDGGYIDDHNSYIPSFASSAKKVGRYGSATRSFLLNGYQASDTPFASANVRESSSRSSSPTSSIKSVTSADPIKNVDPLKKAKLMNELFGPTVMADFSSKS